MIIFTDVIDITGYSDFNESQKVSSGISANLVSRALSALKIICPSRAFKGTDASVTLTLKRSRIQVHSSPCLEKFTELPVKGI
jgi:hypothetical protein